MANTSIQLDAREALFRRCLLDCREAMKATIPAMSNLELRWTGGWVRDKLLGIQSHDIDVALSTMTGEQFGSALKSFMQTHGQNYVDEAKKQQFDASIKDLHKIAANPEKSKHLETITTRMFGIDVDFVNLRKEIYTENNRNPQMEFGTPEEDALRRDATVNALFYNLDTEQVEDFTNQGLQDMAAGVIRTPLAPFQTFKDDPLRVLRLIRFSSRLHYEIEPSALQAMQNVSIHHSLRLMISRERIGVEVEKIVAGPDPFAGLMLIYNYKLYATVFASPTGGFCPEFDQIPQTYKNLARLMQDDFSMITTILQPQQNQSMTWTLATYVPWEGLETEAVKAARTAIKAPNVVSKILSDAIKQRGAIRRLVDVARQHRLTRVTVGTTLRAAGASWRSHVLYSLLCDLNRGPWEDVIAGYTRVLEYIKDLDLTEVASLKPIINGNEIQQVLQVSRPGSWLQSVNATVLEWQLEHPNGTAEQAKAMLLKIKSQLNLPT